MTKEYIIETCKKYKIINYIINDDLSIDVKGNVDLSHLGLIKLPLTFNIVDGSFFCENNKLTSLSGSPRKCIYFYCYDNKLTSLDGAPNECIIFDCDDNILTTLKGAPKCRKIRSDYKNLDLDNEDLYVVETLVNSYNDKDIENYFKIRKRNDLINSILK